MMNKSNKSRYSRNSVFAVASVLRVLVMVLAISIGPLGVTFQVCHCVPCENSCQGDSCCCSNLENNSCCTQECCGQRFCDIEAEPSDYDGDCVCECHVCQCDLGLAVDPERMPGIKDTIPQVLDDACLCVGLAMADSSTGLPEKFEILLTRDIFALHCRWLI